MGISLQNNYKTAYLEAVNVLKKKGRDDICDKSRAVLCADPPGFILPFLKEEIFITRDFNLHYRDSRKAVDMWPAILILHYLANSGGTPATGKDVTFKEITGGMGYYPAFRRRSIEPILKRFDGRFRDFVTAGEKIGGMRSDTGDYSVDFTVFPAVSVRYNIWAADEDFPAEGNIVFDSSISGYLSSEDIAVMCNIITVMIIKDAGSINNLSEGNK